MSETTMAAIVFSVLILVVGGYQILDRWLTHREVMAGKREIGKDDDNDD